MAKQDLSFRTPLIIGMGSLGFSPNPRGPVELSLFGAFTTHPISRRPRRPAETRAQIQFPGGFLLHSGLPNPGFHGSLRRYAAQWAGASLPILVHLIPGDPVEMAGMTRALENLENIGGIELGLREDILPADALAMVQAGLGELPLIACIPPARAAELGALLAKSGAAALSLAPARGRLPGANGEMVTGRLYGPALLPLALEAVACLVHTGLPVIGCGGVYTPADAAAMRAAGALAVGLDAVLWRGWILEDTQTREN
jgi:dihydroorotate dehydrogenase (NAD+) catalytic subunit